MSKEVETYNKIAINKFEELAFNNNIIHNLYLRKKVESLDQSDDEESFTNQTRGFKQFTDISTLLFDA